MSCSCRKELELMPPRAGHELRPGPCRYSPLGRGSRIATAKETSSKRGPQRVAASHSACAQPTASPGATGSSPGSASDGVQQRPAAAAAEARASGSCTAASSRVRPRSTASRALAAPVELRDVVFSVPWALRRRRLWHLNAYLGVYLASAHFVHHGERPRPSMERRDPTSFITAQRRAGSQLRSFYQLKTRPRPSPTLTQALSQPPERIATLARKKNREQNDEEPRIGFGAPFFAHHD